MIKTQRLVLKWAVGGVYYLLNQISQDWLEGSSGGMIDPGVLLDDLGRNGRDRVLRARFPNV